MGTRGIFGFRYKGKYYMVYNQYDSGHMGAYLLEEIKAMMKNDQFDEWLELFLSLKIVTDEDIPTEEDLNALSAYTDNEIGRLDNLNFYTLTRKCQGSFLRVLQSKFILIVPRFSDSVGVDIFIEYVYVLNFDDKSFVVIDYYTETTIPLPMPDDFELKF